MSRAADLGQQLHDLAVRVRHLCPSHRDPEAFHIQKSEIEAALRNLSRTQHQTQTPKGKNHD